MARNEIFISSPPRQVWDLLADPRSYSHWVVGSREVTAADAHWPEEGSAFDNTVGVDGVALRGVTLVEQALAPVLLRLRIRIPPLPDATVRLELIPEREGARVVMHEHPASRALSVLSGPLVHGVLRLRNVESLTRLKELAEGTTSRPAAPLAQRGEGDPPPPVRARGQRRTGKPQASGTKTGGTRSHKARAGERGRTVGEPR